MNWLSRKLGGRPAQVLEPAVKTAVEQWQALADSATTQAHFETRYVVLNTAATGLNVDNDRLVAVACVPVDSGHLSPRDAFYAELGDHPAPALAGLLGSARKCPVVAFNAAFNRAMLEKALDDKLGVRPELLWIDLYFVLPVLFPEKFERPMRLGDWINAFGIDTFQRQHALGDAWAIAQLLLVAQVRAVAMGLQTPRALADQERAYLQSLKT